MSTFLQLVNRLRRECGISGSDLGTLTGLSGESLRCKNWIISANTDIQEQYDNWNWMRASASFTTVASQQTYTEVECGVTGVLAKWKPDSFRTYITSVGYGSERFLTEMTYDAWRDTYGFGSNRTTEGAPGFIAVAPDKSLCLGPVPDATGYTVVGDYFIVPVDLSADSDTPAFPSQFHMLLVYRAMMFYGTFESAPEIYQHGQTEFNRMMRRLELDQRPQMLVGDSLV